MPRRTISPRRLTAAATIALSLAAAGTAAPAAHAAKGGTCEPFTAVVNGVAYTGDQKRTISAPINTIALRGRYITFSVTPSTLGVTNYAHTGADSPDADRNLPIDARTVIFTRKVPRHGKTLTSALSLELSNEGVVLQRSGGGQAMKVQAKNCQQGGLFQMEAEPGTTYMHELATGFHYTRQPAGQTRLCFTNGRFTGYDSPELATLTSFTANQAFWRVASGGRMGMVIGEDALEGGCRP